MLNGIFNLLLSYKILDSDFIEIIKGASSYLFLRFFGIITGYVLMISITRWYGPEGSVVYGKYLLALLVVRVFILVSKLGTDITFLRFVSSFNANSNQHKIYNLYKKILLVVLPMSLLMSSIMFFYCDQIANLIGADAIHIKILSFVLIPAVIFYLNIQGFRGLKKIFLYSFFYEFAISFLTLLFLVFAFIFLKDNFINYTEIPIWGYATVLFLLFVFTVIFWFKYLSKLRIKSSVNSLGFKTILTTSIPLLFSQSLSFIMGWTDQLMLGNMRSAHEVGIYGVAFKYSLMATVFLVAVNSIAAPKFSEFFSKNDYTGLKKVVKQSTKIIFWFTLPIIFIFFLFPDFFLKLSGESFVEGKRVLFLLLLARFFSSICGSVGNLLQMTGNQIPFMIIMLISCVLNITMNVLLIPIHGINGAAIASFASIIFWNTLMVMYIKKKFNFISIYIPFFK
tara:strand:- start:10 stop:1365 length:1356 start_codon:yes stop_codon:yes gene_type:complete